MRLAHGWMLESSATGAESVIREYVRPAVRAIPRALARRFGGCRIRLRNHLANPEHSSVWSWMGDGNAAFPTGFRELDRALTPPGGGLEVELACAGFDPHDIGMELLLCLGQALWERTRGAERESWLGILRAETDAGISGEIDEEALREKQRLLLSRASARNRRRLERYARASFASTAAEYVHCLWHDVHVRGGPEHLPAVWLRGRLELFARWFPPDRGYRLFAISEGHK